VPIFWLNTGIAIGLTLLMMSIRHDGWRNLWSLLATNMIYSQIIGSTATLSVGPFSYRFLRMPRWKAYSILIPSLALLGALCALLSATICWWLRLFGNDEFWPAAWGSSHVAAIVTALAGSLTLFYADLRERVQSTSLELRTQQFEREAAERVAAESRLEALQSRLQPHFLFNTINSVLALIREDPAAAERMLERLSRLLRFVLDAQQKPVVRLDEEVRLVRDYLEIEQTRFGGRLEFTIDAPAELSGLAVPPCALQTLVENSVKYAVAPRRAGSRISIRAARYRDTLALEVMDGGPGFDRSAIQPGHGLDTLEKRLATLYGPEAFLQIENGSGAAVRLRLPVHEASA
jgi:signal transduction histidine kinase